MILDSKIAYRDGWLYLPKSKINEEVIKRMLQVEVQGRGDRTNTIFLWKESKDHLLVPREFLKSKRRVPSFSVVDLTPKSYKEVCFKSKIVLDSLDPSKNSQKEAFKSVMKAGNGILNLSCGSGKTVIMLHVVAKRGYPAIIINDRVHTLRYWEKEARRLLQFDGEVGWVQGKPEKWDWKKPLVLASLKTLAIYNEEVPPEMKNWFGTVVWDECFVKGTLVDGRPIEKIKIGDAIKSYDERNNTEIESVVNYVYKSVPQSLLTVKIENEPITCTANHPFLTTTGWVEASELTRGSMVLCSTHVKEHMFVWKEYIRKRNWKILLRLSIKITGRKTKKDKIKMRMVWKSYCNKGKKPAKSISTYRQMFLLRKMSNTARILRTIATNDKNKFKIIKEIIEKNAHKQSYEQSYYSGKTASDAESHELETKNSRRKWETTTDTSKVISNRSSVGSRVCSSNRYQKGIWYSNTLQDRYSRTYFKNSNRDRRFLTQFTEGKSKRCEKKQFFEWKRVESVEIHEQTSDGTFGGCCPDGFVYNLSVEKTQTFTVGANNAVVHNCHHLSAPEFSKSAPIFCGDRFGITATVTRGDGTEVVYYYHVGPVVHTDLSQDVTPKVFIVKSPTKINMMDRDVRPEIFDRFRNLHLRKLSIYVGKQETELNFIKKLINGAVKKNRDILAITSSQEQAKKLHGMYPNSGLIVGDVKKADDRLNALANNKLIFATVDLAKESLNKRSLDTLFILTEFTKENTIQQAVGRIQRKSENNEAKSPSVVLISHPNILPLRKMGYKMIRYFRQKGFPIKWIDSQ